MATAAKKAEPTTEIVALVEANPVMVLTDRQKYNQFYEAMKRETEALEIDLTTDKGRKAIASMARRVATTKVLIDDAGKKLNEEARERINAIDAARREIREQLDALKVEVRRPLTEWEAAEDERIKECSEIMGWLQTAAAVEFTETAADVRARIAEIETLEFDEAKYRHLRERALELQKTAVSALTAAADRLDREEAERVELEKLRAEAAEREAREAAEREERERAERERLAAEEDARRIAEAEERAAQAAREAEARKAREAEEERERQHQAALAEERRQREEAERVAREEQQRREAEEAERARQAEEDRKREENRAHRSRVMGSAKVAIMACGADEPTAQKIVRAIVAGDVPNVSLRF